MCSALLLLGSQTLAVPRWRPDPPISLTVTPGLAVGCVGEEVNVNFTAYDIDSCGDPWLEYDDLSIGGWPGSILWLTGVYYGSYTKQCAAPGVEYIVVTASDLGVWADDPADAIGYSTVYCIGGPLSAAETTLYYHCDTGGTSTTVSACSGQPTGTTYQWHVSSGPVTIEGTTTQSSVVVRATDPPVGVCTATVCCDYHMGSFVCTACIGLNVRKPYRLEETTVKHVTFYDEPASKNDTCLADVVQPPTTPLWGWCWDVCFRVLDQCGAVLYVPGMSADETWYGYQPGQQGSAEVNPDGTFCDCFAEANRDGPMTKFNTAAQATQDWAIWGCVVRSIYWVLYNDDAIRASQGP